MSIAGASVAHNIQPKLDPVQFVLQQVGADVSTKGYTDKPGAVADSIQHGISALGQFQEVKAALASRLPENAATPVGGATSGPQGGSSATMRQILQTGMMITAGAVAGPLAAAAVGLAGAVYEGAQFIHSGLSHAAIDGGTGELGLKSSLSSDQKGSDLYRDISGDTYTMAGQQVSAPPVAQAPKPAVDPRKMAAAVDKAFQMFTPDQIRESLAQIGAQEMRLVAELGTNLKRAGIETNVAAAYGQFNLKTLADAMDGPKAPALSLDEPKLAQFPKMGMAMNTPFMSGPRFA